MGYKPFFLVGLGIIGILLSLAVLSLCFVPSMRAFLVVNTPVKKADALVVLAGNSIDRLPVAAELYRDGYASTIILTNGNVVGQWSEKNQRNLARIEWDEEYLIGTGVKPLNIIKLPFYKSGTIYDALMTRKCIETSDIRNINIITSDYHTRRAYWVFQRVFDKSGVTLGIYPAKTSYIDKGILMRLMQLWDYDTELVKIVYYKGRFGLFDPAHLPKGYQIGQCKR